MECIGSEARVHGRFGFRNHWTGNWADPIKIQFVFIHLLCPTVLLLLSNSTQWQGARSSGLCILQQFKSIGNNNKSLICRSVSKGLVADLSLGSGHSGQQDVCPYLLVQVCLVTATQTQTWRQQFPKNKSGYSFQKGEYMSSLIDDYWTWPKRDE